MPHKLPMAQKLFLPSLFDLIVMTIFTTMILADPMIKTADIFWHLRTGELLLSGVFPTTDIFSYTAYGKPWILHEWGSQVIFALIYSAMGIPGLIVFKSLVFALMFGLMFKLLLRKNINIFICLVFTLILALGTVGSWSVRPHMFTNLFLVLLFWIFIEFKERGNQTILWALPVLFLFWINLHGGFIIGFVFLAICIGAEMLDRFFKTGHEPAASFSQIKQLVTWTIVSFAACFVNPNTYKGLLYPLMYLGNQMESSLLQEWQTPTIQADTNFFIYMALIVLGFVFSKKQRRLYEIFLLVVFTFLAFSARRHIPVFAIVVTPVLALLWQDHIHSFCKTFRIAAGESFNKWLNIVSNYFTTRSEWFGFMETHLRYHTLLLIVIVTMTAACMSAPEKLRIGLDSTRYPIEMADHIKSHDIQGNILNQYGWGGFLLWAIPDKKVFIDGRMDVYKRAVTDPYKTMINLEEGWEDLIDHYEIKHILLGKDIIMSRFLLDVSDDWVLENQSDTACFFSKKG